MFETRLLIDSPYPITHYTYPAKTAQIGIIIIVHGMTEYLQNYSETAQVLSENGYTIYGIDLDSHGLSTIDGQLGVIDAATGWTLWITHLQMLKAECLKQHPGLPLFILGHSMGSYLAQDLVIRDSQGITGVLLSGTSYESVWLTKIGAIVSRIASLILGDKTPGTWFYHMIYGGFNQSVPAPKTPFDWLSRDDAFVRSYMADPHNGFVPTLAYYTTFFEGLSTLYRRGPWKIWPKAIPLYMFSGEKDPLGKDTTRVDKLASLYRNNAISVTTQLYPGARHVMLGELNKHQVIRDILTWLKGQL
jgi:alpha-beta hydrolase superfamily lysophospholipase